MCSFERNTVARGYHIKECFGKRWDIVVGKFGKCPNWGLMFPMCRGIRMETDWERKGIGNWSAFFRDYRKSGRKFYRRLASRTVEKISVKVIWIYCFCSYLCVEAILNLIKLSVMNSECIRNPFSPCWKYVINATRVRFSLNTIWSGFVVRLQRHNRFFHSVRGQKWFSCCLLSRVSFTV